MSLPKHNHILRTPTKKKQKNPKRSDTTVGEDEIHTWTKD